MSTPDKKGLKRSRIPVPSSLFPKPKQIPQNMSTPDKKGLKRSRILVPSSSFPKPKQIPQLIKKNHNMAAKTKVKRDSKVKCSRLCFISVMAFVLTVFMYIWSLYVRQQNQPKVSQYLVMRWFGWVLSQMGCFGLKPESDDTNSFLQIVQADLETIYFICSQHICLLIPRETTSVLAAIVLTVVTICTVYFAIYSKTTTKQTKTTKRKCDTNGELQTINICTDFVRNSSFKLTFSRLILLCVVFAFLISIPWEFFRLSQIEKGKQTAVEEMGKPIECNPDQMTITQSIRNTLLLLLSWQHNPCEQYHITLLVDPHLEINPLMALSSVITRSLLHPIELCFSGIGKSFKLFFNEIPAPWQPVMLIFMTVIFILTIVMICGYRISLPFVLKLEPKTPVWGTIQTYLEKHDYLDSAQPKMTEMKKLEYQG